MSRSQGRVTVLAALFAMATFCAPSMALPKDEIGLGLATRKPASQGGGAGGGVHNAHYPKLEANLGLGMIFGGGAAALGPEGSIGYSIANVGKFPFYVGGEFGFIFNFSPFVMFIPILPKAYMKFNVGPQVDLKAGIALGPVIGTGGGFSSVSFAFLFEPGVDLWLDPKIALNFDPKFGVIFSTFVFAPQIGVTIPL